MSPSPKVTIRALFYDGTFRMSFLGEWGEVRSAGDGTGACEVRNRIDNGEWVYVPVGSLLMRDTNGEFRVEPA